MANLCSKTKHFSFNRNFKIIRCLAISGALKLQFESIPSSSQVEREVLLLTAACVWLFNALDRRPEDGPSWKRLMGAVLPLTYYEDDNHAHERGVPDDGGEFGFELDTGYPHYPYGAIFLRRILFGKHRHSAAQFAVGYAPRMIRGGRFLSQNAVLRLFEESEEDMRRRYFGMG